MKKNIFFILTIIISTTTLYGKDGVCQKCIRIREENAKKVNPYEYYEDYLKAKQTEPNGQTEVAEKDSK